MINIKSSMKFELFCFVSFEINQNSYHLYYLEVVKNILNFSIESIRVNVCNKILK